MEQNYYALYDCQLGGFKAGHAGTSKKEVSVQGAERAYTLSFSDEEPCPEGLTDEEVLKEYGYKVRKVSKEHYQKILDSEEYGLLTTVSL